MTYASRQYQLMLDKMATPYDGASVMSAELDRILHADLDTEDKKPASELIRDEVDARCDEWFDEQAKKRIDALIAPVLKRVDAVIEERVRAIVQELFGLSADDLAYRIGKTVVTAVQSRMATDIVALDSTIRTAAMSRADALLPEMEASLRRTFEVRLNAIGIESVVLAIQTAAKAHFEKVAEDFINDSLKVKVQYQPTRKLVL